MGKRTSRVVERTARGAVGDIAVIGMSARFPGARNTDEFWQDLRDGVESISFFSPQELSASGTDASEFNHPNYVPAGSILEDIDLFDAGFFGFNPREAEAMDPQQRIFLECAWHCLEDAGYDPENYRGAIGVYAGCAMSTYMQEVYRNPRFAELIGPIQALIGNDKDYLTTHASYKLNLRGPSISVQTTCSTSLVATALACESLLSGRCDMALAGGVCIRVPQRSGYYFEPGGIFSPDGHCRVFDAKGAGVVFGNGVGLVLLKRLEEAIADGDCIDAVIKGVAINNDGSSKDSYTAPSVSGQAEVIRQAQAAAGIAPDAVGYIEAHGTATPLGDPVEIAALTEAFGRDNHDRHKVAIGSVKSNFGHLDHAAGIAGLIKTILALKHRQIPPSLHFESAPATIDFANSPFYVNTKLRKWPSRGRPRRAGVSAFGIGGTNVHVVLEEAPAARRGRNARTAHLLLLSAHSESSLEVMTGDFTEHLKRSPKLHPADVAYTTQVGRRHFGCRRALVFSALEDAVESLEMLDPRRVHTATRPAKPKRIVFMFPGQGAQHVNMAAELYRGEPAFRATIDRCLKLLAAITDVDLRAVLYPSADKSGDAAQALGQTQVTQLALFVVEYALAQLWMKWGVKPQAMIGHSIGEYVAACLAGVFSLADALTLVEARGRLMQQAPHGAMLVVPLTEQAVAPLLGAELSLAAVNAPSSCVVSGPAAAVGALQTRLAAQSLRCIPLKTSHAFHSSMMEPILAAFEHAARQVVMRAPSIPYVSNVTGTWIEPEEATDPNYWTSHLRQRVRFSDGVRELLSGPDALFLEVGPGQQLGGLVMQNIDRDKGVTVLSSLPHPLEQTSAVDTVLTALAKLWLAGIEVDWPVCNAQQKRRRVHLPTYPFERERYWVDSLDESNDAELAGAKKTDITSWFYVPSWEYCLTPERPGAESTKPRQSFLVFLDECGIGAALAERLRPHRHKVITVARAKAFRKLGDDAYEIDAREKEHYRALFEQLRVAGRMPQRVLHLWCVDGSSAQSATFADFESAQDSGFYSLLYTAQALLAEQAADPVRFVVVSNGVHRVTDTEALQPAKSTVLGVCKSIPQEYPNLRFRHVDIVVPRDVPAAAEKLLEQLLAEAFSESSDTVVAYREHQRWAQVFEPVYLKESIEAEGLLRDGGIYLLTGGLGNIGLTLAAEIANSVWCGLALVGRSDFPERRQWQRWLKRHPDDDPVSRKILRLQEIEAQGSEVIVLQADASDEGQMRDAFERTDDEFGALNGVIHGAGTVAADAFFGIDEADRKLCNRLFVPRARGLIVLDRMLRDRDVDFVLIVSSLSSILAGLGYVAYSAAHAFCDAFAAAAYRETGVPWISVNWDNWASADTAAGDPVILPEEGAETLRRILGSALPPQIAVSVSDLQARISQWIRLDHLNDPKKGRKRGGHTRPRLEDPYVPPRDDVEQSIVGTWQDLLGIEQVSVHDNFFRDLRGTSLLATQLVSQMRSRLGVDLPLRRFFEGPTVAEIASAVKPQLGNGSNAAQHSAPV